MRKCPNRLGKFASAILVSIGLRLCFHYNDRQARSAGTATTRGLAVEARGGRFTRQYSGALHRISAHADARGADADPPRQAGAGLFVVLWNRNCDPRLPPVLSNRRSVLRAE